MTWQLQSAFSQARLSPSFLLVTPMEVRWGESVAALIKDAPPGAPVPPILPPQDGFLSLDKAKFPASFAADVAAERAAFMADSQVPWGVDALGGTITEPAWKTKPSWYLVTTDDKMIPPPAQQFMSKRAGSTVVEVKASHAVYVSKPEAVASLIEEAANDVKLADKDRRRPQQEDRAQNAQAESAQVRAAPTEANRPGTR
jgi:pimeloyl-ACP methyl ester carboxylesterase